MEVLRAEEQLEPPKVFLEWEVKTWLVDHLKHMKPWHPLVFLPWAACCHPYLRCMVSPPSLEELSVGYLLVNWAGLCLFPAPLNHVNKRLVPNCGIKWVGAFHHQRAVELHLRRLFVSVETT